MNRNEQLDDLLRQFMDDDHIHDLKEDLSYADKLFETHPVPAVRQETLVSIQKKVSRKLIVKHYWTAGKWIAVAAAIAVVALLSREQFVDTNHTPRSFSTAIQKNDDLWRDEFYVVNSQDDAIERELTELTNAVYTVRTEMYDSADTFSIDMMELDDIEHLTNNLSFGKDNFYAQ